MHSGNTSLPIDLAKIRAIDVHVHAEVSCHDPEDPVMAQFFDAASTYFKAPRERPKIPEIIEMYREANIALCLFTVDCESAMGAKRVSNDEVAEQAMPIEIIGELRDPAAAVDLPALPVGTGGRIQMRRDEGFVGVDVGACPGIAEKSQEGIVVG